MICTSCLLQHQERQEHGWTLVKKKNWRRDRGNWLLSSALSRVVPLTKALSRETAAWACCLNRDMILSCNNAHESALAGPCTTLWPQL
jgi:hypothetical protein